MYHTDAELRRASRARQSEILNVIADYRFLAPAALAARERLETELARQTLLRDGGEAVPARPHAFRHWLGARLIRLGTWLSGTAAPTDARSPATSPSR